MLDNPRHHRIVDLLAEQGHSVDWSFHSLRGAELARRESYDVILIDTALGYPRLLLADLARAQLAMRFHPVLDTDRVAELVGQMPARAMVA